MAMLAAPRRKQKIINLRAKNNEWSNDTTKFGQRMLEKMGWSSGKGLGAKENGMVEHVVAKFKNDDRGLGFEDKNDQWTKHEDDFNTLLANLSNGDSKEEKLHSGVSLETKSKKSKARVHYHKFTRGKDLTRYSDKDLANIFGKKSLKTEVKKEETLRDDDTQNTEQVFTEKGSMEDYFKSKMKALKSKPPVLEDNQIEDAEADYGFQGFSGTNNCEPSDDQGTHHQSFSFYAKPEVIDSKDVAEEVIVKKKKKSKKLKCIPEVTEQAVCENIFENEPINNESDEIQPKKKSKKKKLQLIIEESPSSVQSEAIIIPSGINEEDTYLPKKKKKNKHKLDS